MAQTNQIRSKESRQMKFIKNKPTQYSIKLLVILLPMAIVPMASYDFLTFYFKHSTAIYASMIIGFMIGLDLLYIGEKVPRVIFRKLSAS